MAKIVLVDDHELLRTALSELVKKTGHQVLFEAGNGKEFIEKLKSSTVPDIVLLDINMPEMDGYETAAWIKQQHPKIKILALSMYDNENSVIRMLRNGAVGYILKASKPFELSIAISSLMEKGFYHSELVTGKLIHAINRLDEDGGGLKNLIYLSEKETAFLQFAATELTYKEIAEKMFVSIRTIDGYREDLCSKLNLKSRIGLALYAIKAGLVQV